ncbi:MAG: hypothetical protein IT298_15660 [Chloroflexi bacterium]|nr:hypothetical protein [Chloroflexota bacterium]MBV6437188.1 hypothetical protein [Anaerolineae bacterium]MDL1914883.1 hypothetical protein [Anaerolineae bacterium CFX4]MBW7879158.1 hypothetical protein [Anaerolineae bacterium]MCC6567196.1 hypothetical protein [Chloroflexota bacterium]
MRNLFAWILRLLRGSSRQAAEPLEAEYDERPRYDDAAPVDEPYADIDDPETLVEAPSPDHDGEDVRPSIWVNIKLGGDGLATDADHKLRYEIENAIEERGVGDWYGSGAGDGWMDVAFIVREGDTVRSAVSAVRAILREFHVPEDRVRIDVFND